MRYPASILAPLAFWAITTVSAPFAHGNDIPKFRHVTIDPHVGDVCYAVTLADVDADGQKDIVAVTENRVLWYQAPDWKKRVIIEDQTELDNVCIASTDIDGDGLVDFALGAGWIRKKTGTIQWLSRGESLDDHWKVHFIGAESWLHRMSFADVLGTGKPQLVISPLNRTMGNGVRLMAFEIPEKPATQPWKSTLLNDSLNRMHNHWNVDVDGNGRVDTLTASQEGVTLIREMSGEWQATRLSAGMPGEKPADMGAGEIKTGRGPGGRTFITTIEPMHGTSLVVYTQNRNPVDPWTRHVLIDTLRRGHAIWPCDLDNDGVDEIVAGHSEPSPGPVKGPAVYVFKAAADDLSSWNHQVIDEGGVAVEDIAAADLTGDGLVDIVAGGRDTHNLKLYVNQGR